MIEVIPTKDLDYIRSVVASPGMQKLLTAGMQVQQNLEALLSDDSIMYFMVLKDGIKNGFISFQDVPHKESTAVIHVALSTRGKDTLEAVKQAIAQIKKIGVRVIYAVFPANRKSITRLCNILNFSKLPEIEYLARAFSVRQLTT